MEINLYNVAKELIGADMTLVDSSDLAPRIIKTPAGDVAIFTMTRWHDQKPNLFVEYEVKVTAHVIDLDE